MVREKCCEHGRKAKGAKHGRFASLLFWGKNYR